MKKFGVKMIRFDNVVKVYEDGVSCRALNEISFEIGDKEIISITGPSGSGKTTILNLIGALDKPTSGSVYYDETDLSTLKGDKLADYRRNIIGFVFQTHNLFPQLTTLENVIYPLIPYQNGNSKQIREQAMQLLKKVGLEAKVNQLPDRLSGGESQRVAIARALVNHPKIILADEPTGNLDSATGLSVVELLSSISKEQGITVVLVTHEANLAKMADRVIQLVDGKIEKIIAG
jgi:ABC-type lipoprotein export system ATPase subunit